MAANLTGAPAPSAVELSTGSRTIGEMILKAGAKHVGPALQRGTTEITYAELARRARDVARGLIALGVEPGDRVSILSQTRPEWTVADMGAFCAAAVVAPIYATNSPEECAYVLEHSGARVVFCEDAAQVAKLHDVEHVIVMTGEAEGAITLDELCTRGEAVGDAVVDERVASVSPDDLATLIYTSGTTGPPKGCMLTHDNFLAATRGYQERLDMVREDVPIVFFMFLPLAHSYARIIEVSVLDIGGTLTYWSGDSQRLLEDIKQARPTYFPSVPRVFEKIYTAAQAGVAEQPKVKQAIFNWAVGVGRRARPQQRAGAPLPRLLAWQLQLADRLVLHKVGDLFGGRLEMAASGAAPIAKEVLEFFDACGVVVLEGWGMSETAAAGTINTLEELRFGTVGKPLPGTEVRIAEDGELLMRGPLVFRGYFNNEAATASALEGGWLATGDLATIDADGFVSIVGRKKDLIITSSGKNISPSNIENLLKESRWISQAVVVGDNRPYLVALLTLDPEEAPKLIEQAGAGGVRAAIQEVVDGVNARLARIEQIKKFAILDHDLSQADGELTPTLKVKRDIVNRKFADAIEELYA